MTMGAEFFMGGKDKGMGPPQQVKKVSRSHKKPIFARPGRVLFHSSKKPPETESSVIFVY